MTRFIQFYKFPTLIFLVFTMGCNGESKYDQVPQSTINQQELLAETEILEQLAFEIESQIDELRRANTDNRSTERDKLRSQIHQLTVQQSKVNDAFQAWKASLEIKASSVQQSPDARPAQEPQNATP